MARNTEGDLSVEDGAHLDAPREVVVRVGRLDRYQGGRASSIDLGDPSTWSTTRTEPSEATGPTVPAQSTHAEPAPSPAALDHLLADAAEADEELDAIITRRAVND